MARKDVSDQQVVEAYAEATRLRRGSPGSIVWPTDILMRVTGQCEKVCYRAMERAEQRGLLDFGVSLRAGWLTPQGEEFLKICSAH